MKPSDTSGLTGAELSAAMDEAVDGLGITPLKNDIEDKKSISTMMKGAPDEERGQFRSVDAGGPGRACCTGRTPRDSAERPGRQERAGILGIGKVVKQYKFPKVGFSKVGESLENLDNKLTPERELRYWDGSALKPRREPTRERPILLFIHGTFSKNEAIFEQLQKTTYGKNFLGQMMKRYEVLAFDHPTLSVSPVLNALDLGRILGGHPQSIDVICHSRGGLVTRWWLEAFDSETNGKHGKAGQRRAVLVGAPLAGTSLAAPDKIRHGLQLLTNLGDAIGKGLSLIPCFTVAAGLFTVLNSLGSMVAATPVEDGIVAAIPGLASMSLIENNFELKRLNQAARAGAAAPEYFAISSNFKPARTGWVFWRRFADFSIRAAHLATDELIFKSENDLVMDTSSMFQIAGSEIPDEPSRRYRFKDSSTVYHTNYFLQKETVKFIEKVLL